MSKQYVWTYGGYWMATIVGILLLRQPQHKMSKRFDIESCSIKYKYPQKDKVITARIRKENEIIIWISFMKDLSNPLEYGAPFQAILRDYFAKIQIENYKIKPYFVIDSELVASQNDYLASRLQKLFIYENSYSPDVFIRRFSGLSEPGSSLQQVWKQINLLDCSRITERTILVFISKPDYELTQDDLVRAKMNFKNGDNIVIFNNGINKDIGFAVSGRAACQDKDFLTQLKANHQILKQKSPLEWLSWYKNMPVGTLEEYSINDFPAIFKFGDSLPAVYTENSPQKSSNFIYLPMKFVISKCRIVSESDSVFLVKTSRDAYEDRFRLRRIYRTPDNKPNANYLFVVGHSIESFGFSSAWKLEYEIALYDDILIVDFPDVYDNLPLKTKAMLEFAQSYCKDTEYFYFHDSDALPHPLITSLLKKDIKKENLSDGLKEMIKQGRKEGFLGIIHTSIRTEVPEIVCLRPSGFNHTALTFGKYNLTTSMYDQQYRLPEYCNGQATVFNKKAISKLVSTLLKTDLNRFRIEDIYFTGIIRQKANITKISYMIENSVLMKNQNAQVLSEVRAAMFYHELESENLETMVLNKKTSIVPVGLAGNVMHDSSIQLTKKPKPKKLKKLEEIERVRKKMLNRIENHKKLILRPKNIHHLDVPESPLN